MTRRWQALVGAGLLAAGVLCAYAGSVGADRGIEWLAESAALPAGLLLALAIVFLLRAVLTGRARTWTYMRPPGAGRDLDKVPPSAQTLEIVDNEDRPPAGE